MININSKAYIIDFPFVYEVVIFGYVINERGEFIGYKVFDGNGSFVEVSKDKIFKDLESLKEYLKKNWNHKNKKFPAKDIDKFLESQLVKNEYKNFDDLLKRKFGLDVNLIRDGYQFESLRESEEYKIYYKVDY